MRRLLVVLAVLVLPVAGCEAFPFLPRSDALLVSVERSGGECPDGMCSSRLDLYGDGRVEASDGTVRRVDGDTVRRLTAAIAVADWNAILARPFTGQCPTAYDGQEHIYTFATAGGPVVVASCTTQIDPGQEPFSSVERVLLDSGG
jgi:hypothetical protein